MYIFKMLFSMSGCMNRMTYVLMSLVVGALGYSLSIGFDLANFANPEQSTASGSWIVMIATLYIQAAMLTKRIRDTGSSTVLVWIYYIGGMLGIPLLFFGLVSQIALVIGVLLLGASVIITLYAVFAGSSPENTGKNNKGKSAIHGMAFSDPYADSDNEQADNADAIIANALAERQHAQTTARESAQPLSKPNNQRTNGFGKRAAPAFGNL